MKFFLCSLQVTKSGQTPARASKVTDAKDQPPMKSTEAMPSTKRKKRKVDRDKQIPDRILSVVPESKVFTQMQDFERKIDQYIEQQKLKVT